MEDDSYFDDEDEEENSPSFYARCNQCGAQGPLGGDATYAIHKWNSASRVVPHIERARFDAAAAHYAIKKLDYDCEDDRRACIYFIEEGTGWRFVETGEINDR